MTRVARRHRERRGRGMRGPLAPADLPLTRTRAEVFDDLVLDAVEHLERRWSEALSGVEFAVEEVPPASLLPAATAAGVSLVDLLVPDEDPVPLTQLQPGSGSGDDRVPPRIVLFRRPIEARARDKEDLADLVLDLVIHEVADLLDEDPGIIDPEGHGDDEDDDEDDDD